MAPEPHLPGPGHPQERLAAGPAAAAEAAEESKTMVGPRRRRGRPGLPDAGPLGADIASFRLHLAAEGKAARTVQGYTGAVAWFAAAYLLGQSGKTSWDQADSHDVRQWMVQLLNRYSAAYASIQFRALRQFFKWLATEDQIPDPMDSLRAPRVAVREVPVFTSVELPALQKTCHGSTFAPAATPRSLPCSPQPASGSPSSPGSAATRATPPAPTWTCTPARSASPGKAASPAPSRSATRQPAASTATCAPAPATRRPGGPSYGSARAAAGRSPPPASTRSSPAAAASAA
jgi:hypothetical protein